MRLSFTALFLPFVLTSAASAALVWQSNLDGDATATVGGVNGVLNGDTTGTADRFANAGSALVFDGSGDNVTIDKTTLPSAFDSGSITVWARRDAALGSQVGIVGVGGSGGGSSNYFNVFAGGDDLRADLDDGSLREAVTESDGISSSWTMYAMTFDVGVGGTLRAYINGNAIADTENVSDRSTIVPNADWVIGSDRITDRYFTGAVDDVGVWTNELSATEVAAIYSVGDNSTLQYNAAEAATLFDVFDGTLPGATIDLLSWSRVDDGSLGGADGELVDLGGGSFSLNLGGGDGVLGVVVSGVVIPEPSAFLIWALGLLGLGWCARRRRTK